MTKSFPKQKWLYTKNLHNLTNAQNYTIWFYVCPKNQLLSTNALLILPVALLAEICYCCNYDSQLLSSASNQLTIYWVHRLVLIVWLYNWVGITLLLLTGSICTDWKQCGQRISLHKEHQLVILKQMSIIDKCGSC